MEKDEAKQALLPVTAEDRMAAWPFVPSNSIAGTNREGFFAGGYDSAAIVQAFARHRISNSLPGDVGTGADAQRNIVRAVIDCYNTARPAGFSPIEYVLSKRIVQDAFAALPSHKGAE